MLLRYYHLFIYLGGVESKAYIKRTLQMGIVVGISACKIVMFCIGQYKMKSAIV